MAERVRISGVTFSYGDHSILKQVDLTVEHGSSLIIAGRSGCGKSTLLEISAGLLPPTAGTVYWNNVDIFAMSRPELLLARRLVGYVFQKHALISNNTVFDNLALPLRYHLSGTEKEIRDKVDQQLEFFGLNDIRFRLPEALSVGQARSASIARALIMDPDLLFLDEPTSGLDTISVDKILNTLKAIREKKLLTIIMVTHEIKTIQSMNCPVVVLEGGRFFNKEDLNSTTTLPDIVPAIYNAL